MTTNPIGTEYTGKERCDAEKLRKLIYELMENCGLNASGFKLAVSLEDTFVSYKVSREQSEPDGKTHAKLKDFEVYLESYLPKNFYPFAKMLALKSIIFDFCRSLFPRKEFIFYLNSFAQKFQ